MLIICQDRTALTINKILKENSQGREGFSGLTPSQEEITIIWNIAFFSKNGLVPEMYGPMPGRRY
jgi:hypothetical protein